MVTNEQNNDGSFNTSVSLKYLKTRFDINTDETEYIFTKNQKTKHDQTGKKHTPKSTQFFTKFFFDLNNNRNITQHTNNRK